MGITRKDEKGINSFGSPTFINGPGEIRHNSDKEG
jgi:hypothetical protein